MASKTSSNVFGKLLHIALLQLLLLEASSISACFDAIFSFGDSTADTGNLIHLKDGELATQLPYGQTYFHYPTGRYSNGRLVLDFIAQRLRLPLVPPYKGGNQTDPMFKFGANFAVTGACATSNELFETAGINLSWDDYSLATQLGWFKQLLQHLSANTKSDPKEIVGKSLVVMGEMGVNDYMHFLDEGAIKEMYTYMPFVVSTVSSTIKDLIKLGARTVMVAGMFPMGCMPKHLTMFHSENSEHYDSETGCIKWLNNLSESHNDLLKFQLKQLEKFYPHTKIIYADYYGAIMPAYQFPERYGIDATLVSCCGNGGDYNFVIGKTCGNETSALCPDPSTYLSWDGSHLTEVAYQIIARGILEGPYATPPIDKTCLQPGYSSRVVNATSGIAYH